jgi:hypothetical protein
MQASKHNRRCDDEISAWRHIFAGGGSFDLIKILKNSPATSNGGAAGVG